MRRSFVCDNGGHRGPIGRIWRAGVQKPVKRLVRGVPGQVVVIACMMVACAATAIAERSDNRDVVGLLTQVPQMLAKGYTRSAGCDWAKESSVFGRRIRLHVPGVDVRCAAAEPD